MKIVLLLLLLAGPALTNAQSPFDGTWLIDPHSFQLSKEPTKFLLEKGWFHCVGCVGNVSMQADGVERKIAESGYWDSATVRVADEHTVEITTKKNGKVLYAETDTPLLPSSALGGGAAGLLSVTADGGQTWRAADVGLAAVANVALVALRPGLDDGSFIPERLIAAQFKLHSFREEEINIEHIFLTITKGITN